MPVRKKRSFVAPYWSYLMKDEAECLYSQKSLPTPSPMLGHCYNLANIHKIFLCSSVTVTYKYPLYKYIFSTC